MLTKSVKIDQKVMVACHVLCYPFTRIGISMEARADYLDLFPKTVIHMRGHLLDRAPGVWTPRFTPQSLHTRITRKLHPSRIDFAVPDI